MINTDPEKYIKTTEESIRKCFVSISENCLELRPRESFYGALSGKMFLPTMVSMNAAGIYLIYKIHSQELHISLALLTIISCFISLMLEWAILSRITMLSNIVFNRKTQKCYAYYNNKKYINDVNDVRISGGAKTIISMHRRDEKGAMITKNIEIDDEWNTKIITDYIKSFVSCGSKNLPIPDKYEWSGLENIYIAFPPHKSLCHYAPWPFCGKINDSTEKMLKIYFWPLYTFVIFPINIVLSLLWYPVTKIFNIKPHPVPEEAYEGDDSIRVTPEMTAKGIRP